MKSKCIVAVPLYTSMPLVSSSAPVWPLMLALKRIAGAAERSSRYTPSPGGWRRPAAARSSRSSRRKIHCSFYTVSKRQRRICWDVIVSNFSVKAQSHLCLQERLVLLTHGAHGRLTDVQERLLGKNNLLVFWLGKDLYFKSLKQPIVIY